ncbi:sialidase family protein [Nocardia sp. JMUB6875]
MVVCALLGLALPGPSAFAEPAARTDGSARRLLYSDAGYYPRLIRLQHNGAANGTVLASVNTGDQTGVILASGDGGQTFHSRATIADPAVAADGRLCCSSLYELPLAVGAFPAGTLLWANTFYTDVLGLLRHIEQRLWASTDQGGTWRYVSSIQTRNTLYSLFNWGPELPAAWEPSLSVAADGQLVAFYSDETDAARHSQKLVQVRSPDGVHWVNETDTVVSDVPTLRPGMANTIQLPDGSYFMTYEICNSDRVHQCLAYSRRSADGWNYGDPRFLGTMVRTADGGYTQHTPYPVWSPGPGPQGTILLSGQMISSEDGLPTADSGKSLLANDNLGSGTWYPIPKPIALTDVVDAPCVNYSSALLPASDGRTVLEAATDLDNGICRAYVATGPLHPR